MISFKQFILENTNVDDEDLMYIANLIKRDCQLFLNESGGKVVYRGIHVNRSNGYLKPVNEKLDDIMYIGTIRTDRIPLDSPKWLHDTLNEKFKSDIGEPLRSTSLFVIGDIRQTEKYGNAYMIFPIGNFNYAWSDQTADPADDFYISPIIHKTLTSSFNPNFSDKLRKRFFAFLKKKYPDAYAESQKRYDLFLKWADKKGINIADERESPWIQFVKSFIKHNDLWKYDTGLKDALSSEYEDNEIMISCDKYYAVNAFRVDPVTLINYVKK
jgi:hypothetical protein